MADSLPKIVTRLFEKSENHREKKQQSLPSRKVRARPLRDRDTGPRPIIPAAYKAPPTNQNSPELAPAVQAPAVHSPAEELQQKLEDAIHRTYYKEGGFRFFAVRLCRYTRLNLPNVQDPEDMCAGAYNSCIDPMVYLVQKLEQTLTTLQDPCTAELPVPANQALLEAMRSFTARAETERLYTSRDWEPEAYRAALVRYGRDLQQLLDAFPSLDP